jgi:hypothetical protein
MYSQNNEDRIFLEYFKDKPEGTLLEIGAYDTTTFSNSRALIEKNWNAYLVDASPFCITKLFESYKQNKKVNLIQSLIMTEKSESLHCFYDCPFSAVSSISKEHTKKYYKNDPDIENKIKEIYLKSLTLNELLSFVLQQQNGLDFLSIDVEGFSADLALSMDLDIVKPDCICIEHDSKQNILINKFGAFYNVVHKNGENIIFTKK